MAKAKRKQFRKPPLVEVFSEFFFETAPGEEWDSFLVPTFYRKIEEQFPTRKRLSSVGIEFRMTGEGAAPQVERIGPPTPRHRFTSEDGKTLVQLGENLLVVNQLPPYYGWTKFEPIVVECLGHYVKQWKPARVARAAVHYLDKVDIPELEFNLEDYFHLVPALPEFPGGAVTNITVAYEVRGANDGDIVVTTMRQHPSAAPQGVSFLFQWDYVATAGLPPSVDKGQAWLRQAHDFLDAMFWSTLTDKCRALFD